MAGTLSQDEVATALEALPGWEGTAEQLERVVPVQPQDADTLEDAIQAVADEVDHHPTLERTSEGLHVVLTSHDAGGVTERDVELAARLDRLFSGGVAWNDYGADNPR